MPGVTLTDDYSIFFQSKNPFFCNFYQRSDFLKIYQVESNLFWKFSRSSRVERRPGYFFVRSKKIFDPGRVGSGRQKFLDFFLKLFGSSFWLAEIKILVYAVLRIVYFQKFAIKVIMYMELILYGIPNLCVDSCVKIPSNIHNFKIFPKL